MVYRIENGSFPGERTVTIGEVDHFVRVDHVGVWVRPKGARRWRCCSWVDVAAGSREQVYVKTGEPALPVDLKRAADERVEREARRAAKEAKLPKPAFNVGDRVVVVGGAERVDEVRVAVVRARRWDYHHHGPTVLGRMTWIYRLRWGHADAVPDAEGNLTRYPEGSLAAAPAPTGKPCAKRAATGGAA